MVIMIHFIEVFKLLICRVYVTRWLKAIVLSSLQQPSLPVVAFLLLLLLSFSLPVIPPWPWVVCFAGQVDILPW